MNNFAEGMAAFLIASLILLAMFIKRHWKLTAVAFAAFVIYRHFILKV